MSRKFYLRQKEDFLKKCEHVLELLNNPKYERYSSDVFQYKPKDEVIRLRSLVEQDLQPANPPRETWLGLFAVKEMEEPDKNDPLKKALLEISYAWRRLPPMD